VTPLLALHDLTVRYATETGPLTATRNVSFELTAGQALGIVGESGSGKTTIAGAILNLLGHGATIEGRILFEGVDLCSLGAKPRRRLLGRRIGAVFQDPFAALNPAMTIGRHIMEPLVAHLGLTPPAAFERACELLTDMQIDHPRRVAAAYPHQLSGGMRQRALLAAALACEPPLLILDEPTTALDVTLEAQILALLADLRRRKAVSLLFISHNLAVVREVCDELVVLYASQIVEQGAAADVLRHPQHPYTKGLIASLPRLAPAAREGRLQSIAGRMASLDRPPSGCFFHPRCPFAQPRCCTEVQSIADLGGRRVRCWKAAELGDWPIATATGAASSLVDRSAPLVRAIDLSKRFRTVSGLGALRIDASGRMPLLRYQPTWTKAVDAVSLSIAPGEVVGLVGESGCGKSTLGRLLLRLLDCSAGRVEFDGVDLRRLVSKPLRRFRQSAQIVFQNADSSLNPRLSVGEAIERPLVLFDSGPPSNRDRRVLELLDMVQLPRAFRARYPHQLSGGEKQRVAIARALATEPRFIVCAEPVSALDASVQATIINLMADLRDAFGLAYLFISHDLAVVAQLADRIAVMYRGGLCEIGSTADVLASPSHPYTRALLSSVPQITTDIAVSRARQLNPSATAIPAPTTGCRFQARCPHRLGAVCENMAPQLRPLSQTHSVACHLDGTPLN
jgi:oligopeptide/dipeptide ABC transporter ATP-binding protein